MRHFQVSTDIVFTHPVDTVARKKMSAIPGEAFSPIDRLIDVPVRSQVSLRDFTNAIVHQISKVYKDWSAANQIKN